MPVTCLLACLTCSGAASCQGGRGRRKSLQIPDPQPQHGPSPSATEPPGPRLPHLLSGLPLAPRPPGPVIARSRLVSLRDSVQGQDLG